MISEALELLDSWCTARVKPNLIDSLSGANVTTLVIDGSVHALDRPDRSIQCSFESIGSLMAGMDRFGSGENAAAFVLPDCVDVKLDVTDRRPDHGCLCLSLVLNPVFARLAALSNVWIDQAESIQTLRHDFAGCEIGPESLLSAIRKLKFSTKTDATGDYSHTSAALGRSIESEVTGEVSLPETFSVEFHPYPTLHEEFPALSSVVMCTLFTDPAKGLLKLAALPGGLDRCKLAAASAIAEKLEETGTPVYLGSST